ncbi:PREDICTED: translation initiation factor IF-2-like [Ficedula albicollis]|uniref:translation initiation factor IF-2-like n=1 Tax=Ficedula albicollis TaxID=59894 RepID=UPI000359DF79|nr:PREDICTED: translation initiation factor IF-2-like [Ficedula albicollis]
MFTELVPPPSLPGLAGREPRTTHSPGSHFPKSAAPAEPRASPAAKGKEKARRKSRKKRPAGARSRGKVEPPGPAVPEPGSPNKASSVRGRHASAGTGGTQRPQPGTERPLFPRTKGTEGGGCRGSGSRPEASHGAAMREVPEGPERSIAGRRRKREGGEIRQIREVLVLKCKCGGGGDTATATRSRCHALPGGEIKSRQRARQRDYTAQERLLSGQGKGIN